MKRKITALVLTLVLLLCLPTSASAEVSPEVRNSVAVVRTCFVLETSSVAYFGWGTGFFVNDQYLVTNYHVISDFVDYGAGELVSLLVDETQVRGRAKIRVHYDSEDYVEAFVVGYDEIKDLAILRLEKATTKRNVLELKEPTEDMVGSTIYAIGYPGLAEDILADATSSWGENDSTVTSGTISRLFTQSGTGQRNVQIDCDIKHGNSGGPVVDESGAVIGVATWGFSNYENYEQESMKYAVNIAEVIPLLNQYNVSYTMAESSSGGNGFLSWLRSNAGIILGVIAGLAIIIGGILSAVLLRKKKAAVPPIASTPVEPAKVPVLRSHSKVNYGATVQLSSQPVMIGRGGNCGMRFPQDAPGVSGSHCMVQWNEGTRDFIVTDLNSSYGTFLMTGQKMTPNVPYRLRAGDKFYLADQNNVIAMELE